MPPPPPFSGFNYNRRARGSADPLPLFPMITPGAERRGIPVARAREGNLRPSEVQAFPFSPRPGSFRQTRRSASGKPSLSTFRSLRSVYISPTARSLTAGAKLNFFEMPPLAPRGDGGPALEPPDQDDATTPFNRREANARA